MQTESGRASDFWDKMKGEIRERFNKPQDGSRGNNPGSNPGSFRSTKDAPQVGKHRKDAPGKHRKDPAQVGKHRQPEPKFIEPAKPGKHEFGPGKHRMDDKNPQGQNPQKNQQTQQSPQQQKNKTLPRNVREVPFHNEETGQKHTLHVHLNDDGSIGNVREHKPEGHHPRGRDPEAGKHPHSPQNTHPAAPGKGKAEQNPAQGKPSQPGMKPNVDPLSDPNHAVDKSLKTPIHDQLHRDSQNPLTAPGQHAKPNEPTPIHDDANISNQMNQRLKGNPNSVKEIKNPGDAKNMPKDELRTRRKNSSVTHEAASGLDQIQQTVNVHDEQDARDMPTGVAFPIVNDEWKEETTEDGDYDKDRNGEYRSRTAAQQAQVVREYAARLAREASILYKMADQWGASDSPHGVPGGSVANSPMTTPTQPSGKTYEQGIKDGQEDHANGERPSFADASGTAPDYVRGYSEGYSASPNPSGAQDVPRSMGGDSGQAMNAERVQQRNQSGQPLNVGARLTVSSSFTEPEALYSRDFMKGYNYAARWTPNSRMVSMGSAEFEAGLYAGITDNPQNQKFFVEANKRYAALEPRISSHREYTNHLVDENYDTVVKGLYVQASTSTDLDIMGPGVAPDPMGTTPVMGPGTPPPNEGGMNPARPGGPAPYNGAPPYGKTVVENPVMGPAQESPPAKDVPPRGSEHTTDNNGNRAPNNNIPGEQPLRSNSALTEQFRARVQQRLRERRGLV